MKNVKLFFLAIFASAFLSGCLQVDTKINLNNDGSGTIEETVVIKSAVINMMKEFAMAFDSTKANDFEMFKESEIKDKASNYGEDVKYISGEKVVIDGYEGIKALYSFKDINKIKINPSPEDKMPFGDEFKNEEEKPVDDNLKFNFTKGNPSILVIDFPKPEMKDEVDIDSNDTEVEDSTFNEDAQQKIIEMFDGMKINVSLNFNNPIVETDASFVDGNKITIMQVDFSEIIKHKDVLENLQKTKPETMEQFKEAIGDLPGVKIEFKEKVIIKF